MMASKAETRVCTGSYEAVFGAICDVARAEKLLISWADPATGVIDLSRGASIWTWGENLRVQLTVPKDGEVVVSISSALKFGLVDWGKNQRNINELFAGLEARLVAGWAPPSLSPAAWHPDPMSRHQLRWWDGNAWTDKVTDDGRMSSDPL